MKILLKKGASNEGILDLVAEIIERYHNIQSKRIFQFLGEEVGLAVCHLPPGLEAPAEVQSPAIAALPHQEEVVCHHHCSGWVFMDSHRPDLAINLSNGASTSW